MAEPTLSERVAAEVRAELARQQLTMQHLVERVYGTSPATMRRKLTGLYPLDVDELERVAVALDLTSEELVARASQTPKAVA